MPATLTFFKYERIIQVDSPQIELVIQDLLNQIRNYEERLINLDYGHIANATGKQALGGDVYVGITLELINDWRIQFEARGGLDYVLVNVSGGNLVATNIYSNNPIKPSAFTQVNVTSSSSATLQEISSIQFSSFEGGVTIDTTNGTAGVTFPTGTREQPVSNLADAKTIATARGLDKLFILGNITIGATDNIDGLTLIGQATSRTTITITAVASTVNSEFENAEIAGTFDGAVTFCDMHIGNIFNFGAAVGETHVHQSVIHGTITISSASATAIQFLDCWSGVPGATTSTIDVNGAASGIGLRHYSGGMRLQNISDGQSNSADYVAGQIILDASNTSGDIQIRGVVKVTDNSGAGFIVNTDGVVAGLDSGAIADAVLDETVSEHTTAGSVGKTLKDTKTKATLASLK